MSLATLRLVAMLAVAGTVPPLILKAREYESKGKIGEALEILDLVLKQKNTQPAMRSEALATRAELLVGYGCNAKTIDAFWELLRHAPRYEPRKRASPKIRACFDLAKSSFSKVVLEPPEPAAPPPPAEAPAPELPPELRLPPQTFEHSRPTTVPLQEVLPVSAPEVGTSPAPSLWSHPALYALVASGIAGALGGWLQFHQAQLAAEAATTESVDRAEALLREADRDVVISRVAFGVAGALLGVGGAMWLWSSE